MIEVGSDVPLRSSVVGSPSGHHVRPITIVRLHFPLYAKRSHKNGVGVCIFYRSKEIFSVRNSEIKPSPPSPQIWPKGFEKSSVAKLLISNFDCKKINK